jgi:hypothetical protein
LAICQHASAATSRPSRLRDEAVRVAAARRFARGLAHRRDRTSIKGPERVEHDAMGKLNVVFRRAVYHSIQLELVSWSGASGSGKNTLLRLVEGKLLDSVPSSDAAGGNRPADTTQCVETSERRMYDTVR